MLFHNLKYVLSFLAVGFLMTPLSADATSSPVVITEIAAFESNSGDASEWIEIFNRSENAVDLTGWRFIESSGDQRLSHKLSAYLSDSLILSSQSYAIIAHNAEAFASHTPEFGGLLIDSSWGSLKESGEFISLVNTLEEGEGFSYLSAPDFSLERIDPYLDVYDASNWIEREVSTPGFGYASVGVIEDDEVQNTDTSEQSSNEATTSTPEIVPDAPEPEADTSSTTLGWGTVRINELVVAPTAYETEWIELINQSNQDIDLSGWVLMDGTERRFSLNGTLGKGEFIVIDGFNFQLNNGGDIVTLLDNWGFVIDRISYGNWADNFVDDNAPKALKGGSIARNRDGVSTSHDGNDFSETVTPTRGFANVITPREIALVEDDVANDSINVIEDVNAESETVSEIHSDTHFSVHLWELLPNPSGPDNEGEFIELYNSSTFPVDLSGWSISDARNTTHTFASTTIDAFGYVTIYRPESKITLNNSSGDTIKLYSPDGELFDEVMYASARQSDTSFVRNNYAWVWTTTPTPNAENFIALVNEKPVSELSLVDDSEVGSPVLLDASDSFDPENEPLQFLWSFGDGSRRAYSTSSTMMHTYTKPGEFSARVYVSDGFSTSSASAKISVIGEVLAPPPTPRPVRKVRASSTRSRASAFRSIALHDIDVLSDNANIITEGVVLVEPGVLGAQIFYIGNPGVEVYMHSKDFPVLKTGDLVRVTGVISTPHDMHRIKVKSQSDIVVLEPAKSEPVPVPLSAIDIEDEYVGDVVEMRGEVVSKKSNMLVVESDDGSVQVVAKKSADITLEPTVGDVVSVAGILSKSASGYRLLPRYDSDVAVVGHVEAQPVETIHAKQPLVGGMQPLFPAFAGGIVGLALSYLYQTTQKPNSQ